MACSITLQFPASFGAVLIYFQFSKRNCLEVTGREKLYDSFLAAGTKNRSRSDHLQRVPRLNLYSSFYHIIVRLGEVVGAWETFVSSKWVFP